MHEELIEEWEALLREAGVEEEQLEDMVFDTAERFAAIAARHEEDDEGEADDFEEAFDAAEAINQQGLPTQLNFLIDQLGLEGARDHLEKAFELELP